MADNPFKLVYDALWFLAERNSALTALISKGNRIKYEEWVGHKQNISDADLPELSLLSEGGQADLQNTSSSCSIIRRYMWALTTGNLEMKQYTIISFELFRAMVDWDRFVCGIVWEYDPVNNPGDTVQVVNHVELLDLDEGTFMSNEQNRGIRGWALMWAIEVMFSIPTATLRIPDPPPPDP